MLKEYYKNTVLPAMVKEHGYKNVMSVPKIEKVVVNVGFGREAAKTTGEARRKVMDMISTDLATITGQKILFTKARKSIAGFKIRDGLIIGAKVTLRRQMMWDFLERLIFIALPRTRDFRGLDLGKIDQNGNLNIGMKEQTVFPEIIQEKEKQVFGLQITVCTTAKTRKDGINLFRAMNFPLKKEEETTKKKNKK
ncbi:MAG TPA: 50S ribosomal protein L5 [Candidatus Pacearchaeota archaeon]|jgi:large subunit ribosomal protein L5|nr:50S ribosomal protein L5 [Candidatus Pacearchaeota archaeon]HOU45824.1 50S ribosomal protein L5 [Candidatus Pacearchaeota archaeon]HPM08525.1 50S ribosomal protein L5 [Candidatus Pacearchaeota archaeon]HQI74387.1 50S ribosomal protein L5 [Candidatus Pacearchaeota archaeon]